LKAAYLTIDDAPSRDFLEKATFLLGHRVPAVFFCVGHSLEERPNDAVWALKQGFVIGNHSYSHPHFSDLSLEDGENQIKRTDALIEDLYRKAGVVRRHRYFRFPYFDRGGNAHASEYEAQWSLPPGERNWSTRTATKQGLQRCLADLGYSRPPFVGLNAKYFDRSFFEGLDVGCTFDQAEYYFGNPGAPWGLSTEPAILARIDEDAPEEGRALNRLDTSDVVLVHDHETTSGLFFKIVDAYLKKGLAFQEFRA
jgi:peptidoglycan/xylan/chitin deacetylase (PgdA/CDA1 family)